MVHTHARACQRREQWREQCTVVLVHRRAAGTRTEVVVGLPSSPRPAPLAAAVQVARAGAVHPHPAATVHPIATRPCPQAAYKGTGRFHGELVGGRDQVCGSPRGGIHRLCTNAQAHAHMHMHARFVMRNTAYTRSGTRRISCTHHTRTSHTRTPAAHLGSGQQVVSRAVVVTGRVLGRPEGSGGGKLDAGVRQLHA